MRKQICEFCGVIYDAKLERCPACNNFSTDVRGHDGVDYQFDPQKPEHAPEPSGHKGRKIVLLLALLAAFFSMGAVILRAFSLL